MRSLLILSLLFLSCREQELVVRETPDEVTLPANTETSNVEPPRGAMETQSEAPPEVVNPPADNSAAAKERSRPIKPVTP